MFARNVLFFLIGLVLLMAACKPESRYPTVRMSDLSEAPDMYSGKTITVEGEVTQFLGEEDSVLLLPYVSVVPCGNTVCTQVLLNASQIRVGKFLFSDGKYEIVVSEKSGGIYLPIAFSPAGKPKLPEGRIRITGVWSQDKDKNYILYVSGTETVSTPTP